VPVAGMRFQVSKWWWACVIISGTVCVAALLGAVAVRFMFDAYKIPSGAMAPTVARGDRVLARNISGREARRGDIVIFRGPVTTTVIDATGDLIQGPTYSGTRISRVIAVGRDRIDTLDGRLRLNDEILREPYLPPGTVTSGVRTIDVPSGSVYLMGDNRPNAHDSRLEGPISAATITGRVDYVDLPLDWIALACAAASGGVFIILWVRLAVRRRRLVDDAPASLTSDGMPV
jgi:signal peptidase I